MNKLFFIITIITLFFYLFGFTLLATIGLVSMLVNLLLIVIFDL